MSQTARRSVVCVVLALSAGAATLGIGGCSSSGNAKLGSIRGNPTPELDTTSQRRDDIDNKLTVTNDTNWRLFNEELGRLLLLENPSRMTAQPSGW